IMRDWRAVNVDEGILREETPETNRAVFWLPGAVEGRRRRWDRVSTIAGAEFRPAPGLGAAAATLVQASQHRRGLLAGLAARLRTPAGATSWTLPTGETAEQ